MAANRKNSWVASVLFGPVLAIGGIMALWENEGRFDYAKAAREASEIVAVPATPGDETISLTGNLDTAIPVFGEYVSQFDGYLVVYRQAEIYSWRETREDDRTVWRKGWYGSLDNNSRNQGLRQTLRSASLYPGKYQLGPLQIDPRNIHLVDQTSAIPSAGLTLSEEGVGLGLRDEGGSLYRRVAPDAGLQLGDERVSYSGIRNAPIATYFGLISRDLGVGKQFEISQSLVSALIQNDGVLHHLVLGDRPTALKTLRGHIQRLKWLIRGAGTAAIVIGIYVFFSSFVNLLYRIPLLGGLISRGVFLVCLLIGIPLALFVMLSSILVHHPFLVALPLLAVVGAFILFRRQSKEARINVQNTLHQQQVALAAKSGDTIDTESEIELAELSLANLVRLAHIDGDLDDKERRYISDWAERNGIDAVRVSELIEAAEPGGGEMHATHRDDLILLVCLAMADGALSTKELSRLLAFGKKIGMSARDVRDIILEVESGMLAAG